MNLVHTMDIKALPLSAKEDPFLLSVERAPEAVKPSRFKTTEPDWKVRLAAVEAALEFIDCKPTPEIMERPDNIFRYHQIVGFKQ